MLSSSLEVIVKRKILKGIGVLDCLIYSLDCNNSYKVLS